jgi:hypothetical protein
MGLFRRAIAANWNTTRSGEPFWPAEAETMDSTIGHSSPIHTLSWKIPDEYSVG